MNSIELKDFRFTESNPYIDPLQRDEAGNNPLLGRSEGLFSDASGPLTEQAIAVIAKALPIFDYEKQLDIAGFTANLIDWGAYLPVIALETIIIADSIARKLAISKSTHSSVPHLLGLIRLPLCSVSVSMALIEGLVESVNCARTVHFIRKLENAKSTPIQKLEWIKENFFAISSKETRKVCSYIEEKFSNLSEEDNDKHYHILEGKLIKMRLAALKKTITPELAKEVKEGVEAILTASKSEDPEIRQKAKAMHYQILEGKLLSMRFSALERRITPALAETVKKELDTILSGSKNENPEIREKAKIRAEVLLNSIDRQAKNKVLVHLLGLAAITFALISGIAFLAGVTAPVIFITLGAISIGFICAQYFLKKGTLVKEVEAFYNRVSDLNWIIIPFPALCGVGTGELTSKEDSESGRQVFAEAL
ncbi:MAG: hypothetical protein KR126chlam1_01420 [Chlamydiae bacterium]|nr:hypothetical protein [Chlamydiota bacterium]